jgi:ribosomal protein S21
MIEVKRKPNESVESMFRRFTEILKKEGIFDRAREVKFYQKPKSKLQRKKEALVRIKNKKRNKYLRKIGVLKDDFRKNKRKS